MCVIFGQCIILLLLPKLHALFREAAFVATIHEQSSSSVTFAKAKASPDVVNSLFQCARSCVLDTLCTRFEFCYRNTKTCTLFESGSTCIETVSNCRCFSLKNMKNGDQTCRCAVGYYGDGAQCCQNVIQDCTYGEAMPALSGRKQMISFIKPLSYPGKPFQTVCYFAFGGYTVVQNRIPIADCTDFNRNWEEYRNGFGSVHACFWLGLEKLYHILQNSGSNDYNMDIHLHNDASKTCQLNVNKFNMGNEESNYTVKMKLINSANDPWCVGMLSNLTPDNRPFTTFDHHSDSHNCSIQDKSGWWFADDPNCTYSNINIKDTNKNIILKTFKGFFNMYSVTMQIRA